MLDNKYYLYSTVTDKDTNLRYIARESISVGVRCTYAKQNNSLYLLTILYLFHGYFQDAFLLTMRIHMAMKVGHGPPLKPYSKPYSKSILSKVPYTLLQIKSWLTLHLPHSLRNSYLHQVH